MRKRKMLVLTTLTLGGLAAVTGIVLAQTHAERPDCPGKIVCPITGELICKDRCPLGEKGVTTKQPELTVPSCCAEKG